MGLLKGTLARLRAIVMRGTAERELDDEIRFHLENEAAKLERLGVPPDEARLRALRAFGGVDQAKEAHRDVRGRWIDDFVADVRYAARSLRRSPVLGITATLTLALGVGANAAIFSAVNAVVLRPLPFPASERLVKVWEENPEKGWYKNVTAPANLLDWKEQVSAFQDVAGYGNPFRLALSGFGPPSGVSVSQVTGGFFSVLGVRPALGRTFIEAETWATGSRIVVISDRLWRTELAGDPAVIGRTIQLNGRPVQVVGVMPPGFHYPTEKTDGWMPTAFTPANRSQPFFRRAHFLEGIARLRPGVSFETAEAQLLAVAERLKREYPETNRVMGAGMTPLHEFLVGDTHRPLLVLLGAVALLLLIACANVANLLLVQAAGREREIALRVALGAGRTRLVRQSLTESLVLSTIGGSAGLALGWWGTRALQALQPEGMLHVAHFDVDRSVLFYVLAVVSASALIFGFAPALWGAHRSAADALRAGARASGEGRRMKRWSEALVVGEIALAALLTLGAGLLTRSFMQLQHVGPGFDPSGVMTMTVGLPGVRYGTDEKVGAFVEDVQRQLRAVPGVQHVATASTLPLRDQGYTSDFTVEGWPADEYGTEVAHRSVTPDYFATMRVPVLSGRAFSESDHAKAPNVIIINEALAKKHFKGVNPIGRRLTFNKKVDSTSTWNTIVGVVGSEHQSSLSKSAAIEAYIPFEQEKASYLNVVVRSTCSAASTGCAESSMAPTVRRIVMGIDSALAIEHLEPMSAVVAKSLTRERFLLTLMLSFAIVGLLLAVVGVYGVIAQLVKRRTREMGVRIALGAQTSQVRWLVVRQGLRLVVMGLVVGSVVALLATRAIVAMLFDVSPTDPITFVAVLATLAAAGALAAWVPATQASRADPAVTLRGE